MAIIFFYKGLSGLIDQTGFVTWGGIGFHLADATGPIKDAAYDAWLSAHENALTH